MPRTSARSVSPIASDSAHEPPPLREGGRKRISQTHLRYNRLKSLVSRKEAKGNGRRNRPNSTSFCAISSGRGVASMKMKPSEAHRCSIRRGFRGRRAGRAAEAQPHVRIVLGLALEELVSSRAPGADVSRQVVEHEIAAIGLDGQHCMAVAVKIE